MSVPARTSVRGKGSSHCDHSSLCQNLGDTQVNGFHQPHFLSRRVILLKIGCQGMGQVVMQTFSFPVWLQFPFARLVKLQLCWNNDNCFR